MSQTAIATQHSESFVIEGGQPLSGTVRAVGNKNGALPILAATLLTAEAVTLRNVPRIRDVETMVELLADLGAEAEWVASNEVHVHAAELTKSEPDEDLCRRIRASFLLAGPLLARTGRATMPPPGGDVIGRRRLDTHIHAFQQLGVDIVAGRRYELTAPRLAGRHIFLDEASVMGTENAVMAAVLAEGETVIGNAACEPHVQDLCRMLGRWARGSRGSDRTCCESRAFRALGGGEHTVGADHIEVASFIGLAAVTGGELLIEGVVPTDLLPLEHHFDRLGVRWETNGGERPRPARVRSSSSATTSAARSRRSRTGRGPRSRPTSPRSPSPSRPRPRGRSSSSRRCSRTACSSSTRSSTWARGSSSATRTAPS